MSATYLDRLRERNEEKTPKLETAKTAQSALCSLCSPEVVQKNSLSEVLNDPAGPRLHDLSPEGRSAGWRICRALLSPGNASSNTAGSARSNARHNGGTTVPADSEASQKRAYRWRLHFEEREPMEAGFSPEAKLAEVLAMHPDALAAKPIIPSERQAVPLNEAESYQLSRWVERIGETDREVMDRVAEQCNTDPEAKAYLFRQAQAMPRPDDRRHCRECSSLTPSGVCTAAKRIGALEGYRPVDDVPRRCEGFTPRGEP